MVNSADEDLLATIVTSASRDLLVDAINAEPLGRVAVFFYGTGHMLNDITSACWFTYLLLFLTQIGLSPRDAAIVMLSGQIADAFTTIFAGELIDRFGHFKYGMLESRWNGPRLKAFFIAGAVIWIISGGGMFVLPSNMHGLMYIISIAVGIANALMLVTGISKQSILVDDDLNGCAFVYGSLSFLDKLSCGVALYILESYQDPMRMTIAHTMKCGVSINRYGLGLIPASCALLSAVVTYTMDLPSGASKSLIEPLLV